MTIDHALPIVLSAIALFLMSFLSWMVLGLHKQDTSRVPQEAELLAAIEPFNLPPGNYMFPYCEHGPEMKTPEFQKKYMDGPRGSLHLMPVANMGPMLGLTFLYFLVVSYLLAYLTSMAHHEGWQFLDTFHFVFSAGLMTFLAAKLADSIWFKGRVVGHVFESFCYAVIAAGILAGMWPK